MKISVMGTLWQKVEVNPIDVLNAILVIPEKDWIEEKNGVYVHMSEERNHDHVVGFVSKEIYDIYNAKKLLIKYINDKPIYDKYGTTI